jgi:D-cysteine desulfhydrase
LTLARLPTPFHPLDRLSKELGGPRIWIKRDDLTDCGVSGNKIRKLEFTLARASAQGSDTLITCGGVQSNHCRATALLGAQLGLKVHLILRAEQNGENFTDAVPDGNLFLDYLSGAAISIYEKSEFQQNLPGLFKHWCDHYKSLGAKPYTIPTGASDATGVWGYVHCVAELIQDFDEAGINPRNIMHATGSGGTQAGLTAGIALNSRQSIITGLAVCDNAEYFQRKVRSDIRQWQELYDMDVDAEKLSIHVDDRYIGPGYAKASPATYQVIRKIAALEGLVLDPVYTGKAFSGMIDKIKQREFSGESDVVFIHTGGIFGLLAQREEVNINTNNIK